MTSAATIEPSGAESESAADRAMFSRITWRLLPLLFLAYGMNYIDRINIGYAKLQMAQSLSWSDTVYGLGAGIFFIGYLAFEIPSNLMLEKIGARRTLLRILFCWGIAASALMFVRTPMQFYVVRFVLGGFEAGFFPGVLLYLTYWYPSARRGRIIAKFMVAIPISGVLAGPASGAVLKFLDGVNGWEGWQWLFLVQGLPASVLGVLIFVFLIDRPEEAPWLSQAQKRRLSELLDADRPRAGASSHGSLSRTLRSPLIWVFAFTYFLTLSGNYTLIFMLPSIVRSWGIPDPFMVGIYSAFPYVAGAIGILLLGSSSDRFRERRWHFVLSMAAAVAGALVILLARGHFVMQLSGLSFAMFGILADAVLLFALVTDRLPKAEAAAGIAAISCFGNLGSAVAPVITGRVVANTGDPLSSLYFMIAVFVAAPTLLLLMVSAGAQRRRGVGAG
jgi:MFS family permease